MKSLAGTLLCVLMVTIAGCKPDAAVKHGAVIDSAPSAHDPGKAGQAAPVPPQEHQPQAQTPPPVKVQ